MSETTASIPEGYHTITPHLVCEGAANAIAFYQQAFGAVEIGRLATPDGRIAHAELRIGDSRLMLADAFPEMGSRGPLALGGSATVMHLYVPDADAAWDQAIAAGASAVMPLADMFWGDRYGQLADPFGHKWSVATRLREVTPAEMQEAMAQMAAQQGAGGAQ